MSFRKFRKKIRKYFFCRYHGVPKPPKGQPGLACMVAYNQYGGYCVPLSGVYRPVARRLIRGGVYEPETINFICRHVKEGDIVHAGTFLGDFLPALSQSLAENAKVWAFEPNLESYRCAGITLQINGIENVELQNAGLGEKADHLYIKTIANDGTPLGGASQIVPKERAGERGVQSVPIVAIDDVVVADRQVSIIQLDVEDYEQQALTGALKTIDRCHPIIILEVRSRSTLLESGWFKETILSRGYRQTDSIHGNAVFLYDE